ncbi:MAG: 50S ribosomal protein L6 [Promethearchaeota archaeon]
MVKIAFFREKIDIPEGVKIEITEDNKITISGPKGGPITKDFSHARGIQVWVENDALHFATDFPRTNTLALINTMMNIIKGLIIGVQENYKYVCKICYSHFPCSVRIDEKNKEILIENFLGERAPRKTKYLDNVEVKVDGDDVILIGPDKEALGQTAANLKRVCRIRKKDPRIFQDGIYLYKKLAGEEVLWEIK